ncbi:MAG: FG-GAP repeat domain-containing protein [Thermoleophilia bacterium]
MDRRPAYKRGSSVVAWAAMCAVLTWLPASGCTSTPVLGGLPPAAAAEGPSLASDVAPPFAARSVEADLDGDGVDETAWLGRGPGAIMIADGPHTYSARTKWVVVQATVADTDRDDLPEVVALVEDEEGRHVGLFAWRHDRYRERLVTSELVPTPAEMEIYHDPALGGDVIRLFGEAGRGITYRWNGFGFTAVEGPEAVR